MQKRKKSGQIGVKEDGERTKECRKDRRKKAKKHVEIIYSKEQVQQYAPHSQ
jgi:hypothetical protein